MAEPKAPLQQSEMPLTHTAEVSSNSSTEDLESRENALAPASTEPEYPPKKRVIPIFLALFLVQFLVALDRLIIGTAIPKITDEFNSLGDVGWYASAYMLTACSFALLMGRIYTFYSPKWIYLGCIGIFEIGSAVCGSAPTSNALIVGRAIAGLGGAGLFQGAIIIVVNIVPLHKRPAYMGFFGMVFGVASVIGPLLGGAFTDSRLTWRWCFYINLPIGAVTFIILAFLLRIPEQPNRQGPTTLKEKLTRLDPIGTAFFLPSMICLLLALQWGGLTYSWSSWRVVLLLVLSGLLFIAFTVVQHFKGVNATVPPHIFLNRSILSAFFFCICTGGTMMTVVYYVPIYFQAIHNTSAVRSGILTLPMVMGIVTAGISTGIATKKIGYYVPWMLASSVLTPIGVGLITTFSPTTGLGSWIGFQLLYGLGQGMGMQQPSVAAQTVLSRRDVPTGASLMFFAQQMGGTVFVSVANNLFDDKLAAGLRGIAGVDVASVVNIGATELRNVVIPDVLPQVLDVYNAALRNAFYVALGLASVSIVSSLTMEWKSVKQGSKVPGGDHVPKTQESLEKSKEMEV